MKLDSYFKRIDWKGTPKADLETLRPLHLAHATHIPFENLDIQLGRNILLDLEALDRKLVGGTRGGYCFEQNTLFQAVLREIGFDVIACEARVRMGRSGFTPRTHMLLIVKIEGEDYLADVGFGGEGLFFPIQLAGGVQKQFLWNYQIVKEEPDLFVLQTLRQEKWVDLYAFLAEQREPVDFEVANWYTSTHPQSSFVQALTAQLPTPDARFILRNRIFLIERAGGEESREIKTLQELHQVLREIFHLSFPPETAFHNPKF
jgi:N-hydroxyarylamine O-acetyltransferase